MPPSPSGLYVPVREGRRGVFDLSEDAVGGRSMRSTSCSGIEEIGGVARMLGPSLAKPSATGLSMSARLGFARRLRNDKAGEVVVVLTIGLLTRFSGGGRIVVGSVVLRGGIGSTRRGGANLGLMTGTLGWDCFLLCESFLFFQGNGIEMVTFSLSCPSAASSLDWFPTPSSCTMKTPSTTSLL